ncbi:MAG TPA: hypothetical protein VK171_11930 [Fimbriimonas sp.]|nr:hypothetical protein [Fimbriimonas sp.]
MPEPGEIVSNYPRGEEVPAMTPELAKSAIQFVRLLLVWINAPQVMWISVGLLLYFEHHANTQFNLARQAIGLMPLVLAMLSLIAWRKVKLYSVLANRPSKPLLVSWFCGLIPMFGMFGPSHLIWTMREDMRKFGIPLPLSRFPATQLQAIIDAAEKEKVLVGRV